MAQILAFISAMIKHVKSDAEYAGRERANLLGLYRQIHASPAWDKCAMIIFDMGHLLFEAKASS